MEPLAAVEADAAEIDRSLWTGATDEATNGQARPIDLLSIHQLASRMVMAASLAPKLLLR